ncbi:unnamed protein product [Lactuca saligna]|uniref:Uncharacterized protein n=1 Tax=Lactuca saligna TaxID=75948 RepID=A0AA36A4A6_LACSI|nr:unnamed protein product [Lactuca saligna]
MRRQNPTMRVFVLVKPVGLYLWPGFWAVSGIFFSGQFSMPEQKEIVVVPSSPEASPSPIISSPLVNPGSCFMSGGMPGSPEDSCQRGKPSLIDGTWTSSHSLSFEAYTPSWAITKDSLLSEDTTIQEWSRCAHPPTTMSSIAGQSSARMAGDLCYAATQTSALMVVAADQVHRAGANQR